jgi:glycosyltransferase involved in cell wall biosynthesis
MNIIDKRVSVIIPTYKREVKYLSRAVESILNQTYKNIEIIVIDDSPSTYSDRYKIKSYMDSIKSSNVMYIQNEKNLGGSLSRNVGISIATGEYITFLDDDDKYLSKKIEKQLDFMVLGDYDLTFANMIMHNDKEEVVDIREYHDIPSFDNKALLHYHLMKHLTGTPTFMFKAKKLKEIGGFEDATMGQEFYLMLKSIEKNLSIGYFDDCDIVVYKHKDGGITQGKNKINGENILYKFKQKYFEQLNKKEKRYIRFRHYAVLVVAYKRNNMFIKAVLIGMVAFLSSPLDFIKEVFRFYKKITLARKGEI